MKPIIQELTPELNKVLFAMLQRNLVYNSNFVNYSNQVPGTVITYNHPDGWVYTDSGSGGSISFNQANNCCRIIKSSSNSLMIFSQALNEFPRWQRTLIGKEISVAALVSTPSDGNSTLTLAINDGVTNATRKVSFEANQKQLIEINFVVSENATELVVSLESSSASFTIDIYQVYANIGEIALPNLPCMVEGYIGERKQYISTQTPPINELSLCNESCELTSEYTRLNSVINGRFGTGPNNRSLLPDMRGYFSRAWDNGSGNDPDAANRTPLGSGTVSGDAVGTVEPDIFRAHTHPLKFSVNTLKFIPPPQQPGTSPLIDLSTHDQTDSFGGAETRGKNISELYTIKWA